MQKKHDFSQAMNSAYTQDIERDPLHQRHQITLNLDGSTLDYFKELSREKGIPYETLISLCLIDCASNKRKLTVSWE